MPSKKCRHLLQDRPIYSGDQPQAVPLGTRRTQHVMEPIKLRVRGGKADDEHPRRLDNAPSPPRRVLGTRKPALRPAGHFEAGIPFGWMTNFKEHPRGRRRALSRSPGQSPLAASATLPSQTKTREQQPVNWYHSPVQGTHLLCTTRGHSYFELTVFRYCLRTWYTVPYAWRRAHGGIRPRCQFRRWRWSKVSPLAGGRASQREGRPRRFQRSRRPNKGGG